MPKQILPLINRTDSDSIKLVAEISILSSSVLVACFRNGEGLGDLSSMVSRSKQKRQNFRHKYLALDSAVRGNNWVEISLQERREGSMESVCDFCGVARAVVYCKPDSARLCLHCDGCVHSANFLSRRHPRSLLCDKCSSQPCNGTVATHWLSFRRFGHRFFRDPLQEALIQDGIH
ncbi:ZINC FINGER PROTEIN CONSTANS-LIKE 10 [Salix purpurea]|uniref:ZINC FINGER PROTEIN CONSTANS-LIKE 10 n=1 Tax=Salix purpurea TaxID=77065 RepID=A0A9Q0UQQ1_SALPP|nr:ZINC FINGER PROTEIN CONSTANS-LIKE 10 [Salix purpurea]